MSPVSRKSAPIALAIGVAFTATLILLFALGASSVPLAQAQSTAPGDVATITLLHTNDFHGNLEPAGSNPGMARVGKVVADVRAEVGAENVVLLDAGDIMQGTLHSNLF